MAIKRFKSNKRMSQAVVHNDTLYTAGQVALTAPGESVGNQTKAILAEIDQLLADAGSDKSRIISATIWLASMDDFAEMNTIWDEWVLIGETPTRACVESKLATPDFAVEIAIIAALD
ncbi:MAG: enamine deaminase RidA (YjgF/YER057c/UK114 family) [Candidatus Azotimanducaceae bacterium]|jgi:enamine deaminase RidA (YjgF/YER057c/UK114 family)